MWQFDILLGAIYLQIYWLITSDDDLGRCEYCGRTFFLTRAHPEGRKRHRDKRFRENACRQAHHRSKKKEPEDTAIYTRDPDRCFSRFLCASIKATAGRLFLTVPKTTNQLDHPLLIDVFALILAVFMIGNLPITLEHLPITPGQTGNLLLVIGSILVLIGILPIKTPA